MKKLKPQVKIAARAFGIGFLSGALLMGGVSKKSEQPVQPVSAYSMAAAEQLLMEAEKRQSNEISIEDLTNEELVMHMTLNTKAFIEEVHKVAEEKRKEVEEVEVVVEEVAPTWNGQVLTASLGVVQGPSGKESYYNLPMGQVVANSHASNHPNAVGEYWVREDGVKMLGDFIMVAADISGNVHNRYDLVDTSLGKGIVVDTGTFVYTNPTQIDIAVTW